MLAPDGANAATVIVATAVAKGDTVISIRPHNFAPVFKAGSVVRVSSPSVEFPYVPNRWLISRFHNDGGTWKCKAWVVRSDYLTTAASVVASTAAVLSGTQSSIPVAAPGVTESLVAGQRLEVTSPDGNSSAVVTASQAVPRGAVAIPIAAHNFAPVLAAGSSVRLTGTSAFLNPEQPTFMQAEPGKRTTFEIQSARIGAQYRVEAWEAEQDIGGNLFLNAVGPGDVTFAAYVPLVRDVFSFTDTDLPAEGTGLYHYTYLVTGWYSDPETADPMRGVTTFVPGFWKNREQWQTQTPAERFQTLLDAFRWSVSKTPPEPPATSLYHSLVADVEWPHSRAGQAEVDENSVLVAVGNTAIDGVAALINAYAQKEARDHPGEGKPWIEAGETLANLMQAAQYDLLKEYGKPGGAALIEERIHQAWFGSEPGGTLWEVVAIDPDASGQQPPAPDLTPPQRDALDQRLAALNDAQSALDDQQRTLASLQTDLYMMWWKIGRANSFGFGEAPTTTPPWKQLKPAIENTLYPDLFQSVWSEYCAVAGKQAQLPDSKDETEANQWANSHWTFPKKGWNCPA